MEIENLEELEPEELIEKLQELKKLNEDHSSVIETQNKKLSDLEEQLNITSKTLEEIQANNKKDMPEEIKKEEVKEEVEKVEEVIEKAEEAPVEKEKEVAHMEDNKEEPKIGETIEERLTRLENEKLREKLDNEIKVAMGEYPNAVKEKVLVLIANGDTRSVIEIAKESHEQETSRIEEIKAAIEKEHSAEIEERVRKELAGSNVLPQSPGSGLKDPSSDPAKKMSGDEAWAAAKKRAAEAAKEE